MPARRRESSWPNAQCVRRGTWPALCLREPDMDFKTLLTTFVAVFLAELGDKTQLATLALASGKSKLAVFVGSASALVVTSALAVLGAGILGRWISPLWLGRAAGVVMMALGGLLVIRARN